MKKNNGLIEKISSFIFKKPFFAAIISLGFAGIVGYINYTWIKDVGMKDGTAGAFFLFGFMCMISAVFCVLSIILSKFGPPPKGLYFRDPFKYQYQKDKDIGKYMEHCLYRAAYAFVFEFPLGVLSIALKLILQ
ncbi:MAG: hypothetical protein J6Q85_00195 [Clostridia bacterium]|nr:hypothetical protein [Clostridia bacterium]